MLIAVAAALTALDRFRLAEGCFAIAAVWCLVWISLRPYFSAPWDGKKTFYLWILGLAPLVVPYVLIDFTEQYSTKKILDANDGWLLPAGDIISPWPNLDNKYRVLVLGSLPVATKIFPQAIIKVHGQKLLSIDKKGDAIAVSANIFSRDGRVIAVLENNHWTTNPNNVFKKDHPDFSTLIVCDQYNKEVLNVRYLNEMAIRMYVILRYNNTEVEFNEKGVFLNGRPKLLGSAGFMMPRGYIFVIDVDD